jgi:acetyl esterase
MAVSVTSKLEAAVFRSLLGLPPALVRRLAGRPVVVEGQTLDPEAQLILRLERALREPPVEDLPIPEGRAQLLRQTRIAGGRQPIGATEDLLVAGAEGQIAARLYVPRALVPAGSPGGDPLLFFVHGGGMVYGSLDSHDAVCRFLAERAQVRVLSVDYRLAPERPFPAPVDDCWAAYQWTVDNTGSLGADPERIAVAGDSAGGYLGAVTAIQAAEAGLPVRYQLLIYPVTDMTGGCESRRTFAHGFYLTREFISLAELSYLHAAQDRRDPRVSPLFTEKVPDGLAPAFVATAGFDPLRDEGEAYARLLADHGVPVELKRYPGHIHGFANIVGAGRSHPAAVAEMAAKLKAAMH